MELVLKDLQEFILSPANVFWKQKNGKTVLLSKKSEFLNIDLIQKLSLKEEEIHLEEAINYNLMLELCDYFTNHKEEKLVKDKLQWRRKICNLLSDNILSQFEVNLICFKIFCNLDNKSAQVYLNRDLILFKRSLSIASNYSLCAFLLGYYDENFLSRLFSNTFCTLMAMPFDGPLNQFKSQCEQLRGLDTWEKDDVLLLQSAYGLTEESPLLLAERFNGTGLFQINRHEMTDLEKLLIDLNDHYSFISIGEDSIVTEIFNSKFKCEEKVLRVLRKSLLKEDEPVLASA